MQRSPDHKDLKLQIQRMISDTLKPAPENPKLIANILTQIELGVYPERLSERL